ncbi:hypothetical protein CCR94_01775 [Rhodoblastus sphagnicola]|uniref:DUF1612 domain-containing protein n=1 Tax=Rhodoblastus sphagnicola TaxID=333368 RepID=A0A2S6NFR5_9HYPH|nr:hypothetical protein CCR94_01775 [Rhodoblastus sphagnicola]
MPPALVTAVVAATWDDIEPLQHAPWLGRLLAALLRQRRKTRSHLLCVNSGARVPAAAARASRINRQNPVLVGGYSRPRRTGVEGSCPLAFGAGVA